jgi:cytochrome P450
MTAAEVTLPPAPRFERRRFPPAGVEPRLLQTLRTIRDPLGYLSARRSSDGPVFTLRLYPYAGLVCATDPVSNREVLTDNERFVGGTAASLLEPVIGPASLLLTPPPQHLRNRKLLLPSFHGERVARWSDTVAGLVSEQAPALITREPVAVRPWAQWLTLEVILRVVFGLEDPAHVAEFRSAIDELTTPAMQLVPFVPGLRCDLGRLSPGATFARRRARFDALMMAEIAARRAAPDTAERDDVLSVLLGARDEQGHGFSDAELRDELTGLVLAGHETTATALAWILHLLAHTPSARDALIDDLDAGGDTMLKATIKEAMRMRAPVMDAIRNATQDTELGGQPVPRGAFVSALFCVMHVDPDLWPQPHEFRPGRHLNGDAPPYSLTPFGGGVRRCLGAALAQMELEVVTRELLSRAMPEPAGRQEPARLNSVTLVPAKGGRVVLRPRTA